VSVGLWILAALAIGYFSACVVYAVIEASRGAAAKQPGVYVDSEAGVDTNSGTVGSPVKTLTQALKMVRPSGYVMLKAATATEHVKTLSAVQLSGDGVISNCTFLAGATVEVGGHLTITHCVFEDTGVTVADGYGTAPPVPTKPDITCVDHKHSDTRCGWCERLAAWDLVERHETKPIRDAFVRGDYDEVKRLDRAYAVIEEKHEEEPPGASVYTNTGASGTVSMTPPYRSFSLPKGWMNAKPGDIFELKVSEGVDDKTAAKLREEYAQFSDPSLGTPYVARKAAQPGCSEASEAEKHRWLGYATGSPEDEAPEQLSNYGWQPDGSWVSAKQGNWEEATP